MAQGANSFGPVSLDELLAELQVEVEHVGGDVTVLRRRRAVLCGFRAAARVMRLCPGALRDHVESALREEIFTRRDVS